MAAWPVAAAHAAAARGLCSGPIAAVRLTRGLPPPRPPCFRTRRGWYSGPEGQGRGAAAWCVECGPWRAPVLGGASSERAEVRCRGSSQLGLDRARHPESSTPLIAIGTANLTASGARGLRVRWQWRLNARHVRHTPGCAARCGKEAAAGRRRGWRGMTWRGVAWRGAARRGVGRGVVRLTGRPASSPALARRQGQLHPQAAAMPGHRSRRRVRLGESGAPVLGPQA